MIRVFSVPGANKVYQFRRGSYPAKIYSMTYNLSSTLLCVSSDTETVHIFKLSTGAAPTTNGNGNNNNGYGGGGGMVGYNGDQAQSDTRGRSGSMG